MLNRLKQLQTSTKGYIGIPIVLLMILAMVILPLPPLLLDALFTFNIVLAILVLLVSTTAKRPLDFSVFPTILLVATLLRLTLNVASTRIVLLEGHNGGMRQVKSSKRSVKSLLAVTTSLVWWCLLS